MLKVQSSIEKFYWSKKLRNTEYRLKASTYFHIHFYMFFCVFDNGTLHKVGHNFHLKIRNISELTTCPVEFGTTCPSVIFLLATGLRLPCSRYLCY